MKADALELAPSPPSGSGSRSASHRGTVPATGEEELADSPPPYTPGPTAPVPSRRSGSSSGSSSSRSRHESAPLRRHESGSSSSSSSPSSFSSSSPRPRVRARHEPPAAPRPAGTTQPPRLKPGKDWSREPGCCFSSSGGCCCSSEGGCCFSTTEGCCFSSNKGCCFSADEGACCCGSVAGEPPKAPRAGAGVRGVANGSRGVAMRAVGEAGKLVKGRR